GVCLGSATTGSGPESLRVHASSPGDGALIHERNLSPLHFGKSKAKCPGRSARAGRTERPRDRTGNYWREGLPMLIFAFDGRRRRARCPDGSGLGPGRSARGGRGGGRPGGG